jgi:hypothetical protein
MPGFAFDRRFPFDVKRVPGHDSDSVFKLHTVAEMPVMPPPCVFRSDGVSVTTGECLPCDASCRVGRLGGLRQVLINAVIADVGTSRHFSGFTTNHELEDSLPKESLQLQ